MTDVSATAALLASLAAAGWGDGAAGVEPFTQEAVARGVVYVMQPWPQQDGYFGFGCGLADLDADGDQDIIILGSAAGLVGVFENDGTGFFTDRSAQRGIPILAEASGLAAADVDDDGLIDLYITRYGLPNVLARNGGGFHFTDVAAVAGVADPGNGKGACFGDFDGDQWLDLYVCNYSHGAGAAPNRLYRNLGGASFADVGAAQGVADPGASFEAVWTDYDRDGDVDLYLSNDKGIEVPSYPNQLWRNDGGQTGLRR